ncbi:putative bifunctional diguanylate cyclase/phosphodiesterase [Ideonella sp.]|uniref:putative bifunctional diguanylate cyclase/phosphodiesterase n=1 Tax=Ideonella sp. TaxID=1929293 RepID=UPI002B4A3F4C|nr:EAL domain-containing protein [Ideonella sp.]HJV68263.1 EAL domain-containing protein [Ideonella sp.]
MPDRFDPAPEDFSADQFRLLADNVPALIACYDAATRRCLFANKQYARTFGCDERSIVGRTFAEVIGETAAREIAPQVDHVLEQREAVMYERQLRDGNGQPRWIEVNLLPHLGADGTAQSCFVLINDITKHRLAEASVRESEERLAKFMQASVEGIVFHKDGLVTDANPPMLALIGYTLPEILGRHVLSFIAPEHVARVLAVMSAGQETTYELAILHKDGTPIPVEFIVRTMLRNGERIRMTIVRDMRDRYAAQARIHHLAHHDVLTGLPNRASFMERLDQLMTGARESDGRLALLFVDLDHFKRVNDSLGHLVGDSLLRTVAGRITECLRASDLVARFGGDEFMVLLPAAHQRVDAEEVAHKLLRAIEQPMEVEGQSISVTPSIGIAFFPDHGDTPATLIKHADTAMYVAKSRGRANCQFFEASMASLAYEALLLEIQLAQALERSEFELVYQPLVRARDGQCVGAEALIRWHHPERGLLGPDEFVPMAEQRRLMRHIGRWAVRQAVQAAKAWHAEHGSRAPLPVAVNLSSLEFHASDFADGVAAVLREEGVPGAWLELELTERVLMDDIEAVKQALRRLKRLGVRVAIDDFGTGHSSLSHLRELAVDKIKIDRSFVAGLPADTGAQAIARAVVQLAHGLNLSVTAEGVETEAQREALIAMGCDELQGFLISRPLPARALGQWLHAHAASLAAWP